MAFVTVGFLLVFIFQYSSTIEATESITSFMYGMLWWKAVLIGCSISITMEALQFCFMKGFSEVDDVMHNTVGCLIGWCMVKGSRLMVKNNLRYEQDENRG